MRRSSTRKTLRTFVVSRRFARSWNRPPPSAPLPSAARSPTTSCERWRRTTSDRWSSLWVTRQTRRSARPSRHTGSPTWDYSSLSSRPSCVLCIAWYFFSPLWEWSVVMAVFLRKNISDSTRVNFTKFSFQKTNPKSDVTQWLYMWLAIMTSYWCSVLTLDLDGTIVKPVNAAKQNFQEEECSLLRCDASEHLLINDRSLCDT